MHRPGIVVPVSVALLTAASALAQDECSSAVFIPSSSLPFSATLSTATLTASANPPTSVAGPCNFLQWTPTTKDGWYRIDISEPSLLTVSLCSSNFDTSLVLYRGSCSQLTRVACDDDDCQPSGPGYQSRLVDTLVWPGSHYIRIGGYNGATGTVNINVSLKPVRGDVVAWGDPTNDVLVAPTDVLGITGIAAGFSTTYALLKDDTVRAWGLADFFGTSLLPPAGLTGVRQVAASYVHALALKSNGTVTCWGSNDYGEGTPPTGLSGVTAIGAGNAHSLAVKSDGTIVCWGPEFLWAVQCSIVVRSVLSGRCGCSPLDCTLRRRYGRVLGSEQRRPIDRSGQSRTRVVRCRGRVSLGGRPRGRRGVLLGSEHRRPVQRAGRSLGSGSSRGRRVSHTRSQGRRDRRRVG